MEMKPFRVTVHIIEPGFFGTGMTDPTNIHANIQKTWDSASPEVKEDYGEEYLKETKRVASESMPKLASERLDYVVDAYEHAVLAYYPRGRYLVGYDANYFFWVMMFLPEWLTDWFMLKSGKAPLPASVINKKYSRSKQQ